jgi:UDP-N-acetylmuramate dehydrogenase
MQLQKNVSLRSYSTMRLGGAAHAFTEIHSKEELKEAVDWAMAEKLPVIVIGEGSNIVWKDEGFDGLVIANRLSMFEKVTEDETSATYMIGGGEEWDKTVARLVALKLSGVECLSLIPGSTGATPVQNVGAYGQEISRVLVSLEAYDSKIKEFVTIANEDCDFGYRTSRFKTTDKGRYFIASITLRLSKSPLAPPFYASLQAYLNEHHITSYTPQVLRDAVVAIRSAKLPDWHTVANNGSFFANPIVENEVFEKLKNTYPDIIAWEYEGKHKIAAGWLMDKAGLKDFHDAETGMATWSKQALVIVNEKANSTADLLKFKQKIVDTVQQKFDIILEQEPELIP